MASNNYFRGLRVVKKALHGGKDYVENSDVTPNHEGQRYHTYSLKPNTSVVINGDEIPADEVVLGEPCGNVYVSNGSDLKIVEAPESILSLIFRRR